MAEEGKTKLPLEKLKQLGEIGEKIKQQLIGADGPFTVARQTIRGKSVLTYPKSYKNMTDYFETYSTKFANNTFLVYENERYTFAEVRSLALALSYQLANVYGVKAGDRVALAMKNYPEWCITFMASTYAGAVCVPLNVYWTAEELEYGFQDSGSKILIADGERYFRALSVLKKLGLKAIVTRAEEKSGQAVEHDRWATVLAEGKGKSHIVPRESDDNVAIMYTSGTTGHPKGVVLTHWGPIHQMTTMMLGNAIADQLGALLKLPPDTDPPCILCPVPLFHVTACHHIFLASFLTGRKTVLMTRWDATEALRLIERERPTLWTGVPTMASDLMAHPDFAKTDTSSLKLLGGGGAATPKAQVFRVDQKFKNARPIQGYGLTETNGGIATISGDSYVLRPGSTGQPYPCVEVKLGGELRPDKSGELLIRSAMVMKEYWNKPKATKEVLSDDGWFKTGDVAKIDEEGYIYIVDRVKDIIIRGGENISCAEVENAIHLHPAVHEVAVFGLPDTRLGERPAARVMIKEGKNVTGEEIVDFIKSHIASFKIPRAEDIFLTREALSRGATGKTQRRDIRDDVLKQLKQQQPRSKL